MGFPSLPMRQNRFIRGCKAAARQAGHTVCPRWRGKGVAHMFDGLWGPIATVVAAAIAAIAVVLTQRKENLIKECRLAVEDLKRFRQLEEIWAKELVKYRPDSSSPNAERLRMRGKLSAPIGDYGEPKRIERLLARLR